MHILMAAVLCGAMLLYGDAPTRTQSTTSSVSGTVIDASGRDSRPVASATVALVAGGRTIATAVTGGEGQFRFTGLTPPCNCTIRVTKSRYFDAAYGSASEVVGSRRLVLTDGQALTGVNVTLTPYAAIAGRVASATGQPLARATVRVINRVVIGPRAYDLAGTAVQTNDLGEYEIDGLAEGTYIVQLPAVLRPASGGHVTAQAELFYPNAPSFAEAQPIVVAAGARRVGIDFEVTPVKGFALRGEIAGPTDALRDLTLRLVAEGSSSLGTALAVTPIAASGKFEFADVPPGRYLVEATSVVANLDLPTAIMTAPAMSLPLGGAAAGFGSVNARIVAPTARLREWATTKGRRYRGDATVTIEDRDVDVVVPIVTLASVSGTLKWDQASTIDIARIGEVRLESVDGDVSRGVPRAHVRQDGERVTFTIDGVRPGEYLVRVGEGLYVESLRIAGVDAASDVIRVGASDTTVDLTLASRPGTVTGVIESFASAPASVVLAFPTDRSEWGRGGWSYDRVRLALPQTDGSFSLDLPAGTFSLIAVASRDVGQWRDPSFLERAAPFATRVTVTWGAAQQSVIRLLPKG